MKGREAILQEACVRWFGLQYPEYRGLLFHVPNGGSRNLLEARSLKAQGVVPGVADLILLLPRKGFGALCIEMKTQKGRLSEHQREWEAAASLHGNLYRVCRSIDEFIKTINDYLI